MNIERNKLLAAFVSACLVAAVVSVVADSLYEPSELTKRGYQVIVSQEGSAAAAGAAEQPQLSLAQLLSIADPQRGKVVSGECLSCHSFEKGGPNKVGPNLWGVLGSVTGSKPGYQYSKAMSSKGGSWDFDSLASFLFKPQAYVPGTKMSFAGLRKMEKVADLLLYMNTMSDSPIPVPNKG